MGRSGVRRGIGIAAVALLLSSCAADGPGQQPTGPGLSIVVTTSIWGDLVQQLVEEDAAVEVLIEPGQDAHAFDPSAQQAAALLNADLAVANGLGLEEGMTNLLESAADQGVRTLELAPLLDPVEHGEPSSEDHTEGEHESVHEDPHVFHDPVRVADAVRILATEIAELDNELDDATWTARGEKLAQSILAEHADGEQTLAPIPSACRKLVTSHDSLSYFAERYDFEVIGTVIPGTSSTAGASASDFAALANAIRDAGVPAIFTDAAESTRLAQALANEVGEEIAVVALHVESLGAPGSGAETYGGLVRTNAMLVAQALAGCQG